VAAQLRSLVAPATVANGELLEDEDDEGDVGDDADEEVDGAEADLNEETLPLKLRLNRAIRALRRMASQTGLSGPAGERRRGKENEGGTNVGGEGGTDLGGRGGGGGDGGGSGSVAAAAGQGVSASLLSVA
jgi:hypothetical protein